MGTKKPQLSERAGFLFLGFVAFLCLLHSEIVLRCTWMYVFFVHNTGNFLLGLHRNQNQKQEKIRGLARLGAIKET